MISVAQDDGANKDILKLGTHSRPKREAIDDYTSLEWETLCREVVKLRVERSTPTAATDAPSATLLPDEASTVLETPMTEDMTGAIDLVTIEDWHSQAMSGIDAIGHLPRSTPGAYTLFSRCSLRSPVQRPRRRGGEPWRAALVGANPATVHEGREWSGAPRLRAVRRRHPQRRIGWRGQRPRRPRCCRWRVPAGLGEDALDRLADVGMLRDRPRGVAGKVFM
jgi:hypothetical protein